MTNFHCEKYADHFGRNSEHGAYNAVVYTELPMRERSTDSRSIMLGYAVKAMRSEWFFFEDLTPAYVYCRSARMSLSCHTVEMRSAALDYRYCEDHQHDESALLLGPHYWYPPENERTLLDKFAKNVSPESAHWKE